MNLRDLRYLVALAEHRHFSKAAEASFVSQPTLSTQIKKLEEQLGVQLVERTPRQVLLTPVGVLVAERARAVLSTVAEIREISRQAKEPDAGRFTLGIFPTLAPYLLPHVVPQLHNGFPKLELYLVEEKTEALIEGLAAGTLDAVVLADPVEHERFTRAALFEEPFVLAVPARHILAERETVQLADLAGQHLLLLQEGHCLRAQALSVCAITGAKESQDFRATSLETLRQMVSAGVGLTLLPMLATQPPVAPNPALKLLRFAAPSPTRSISMFWRNSSPRSELYLRLAELLAAVPADRLHPKTLQSWS